MDIGAGFAMELGRVSRRWRTRLDERLKHTGLTRRAGSCCCSCRKQAPCHSANWRTGSASRGRHSCGCWTSSRARGLSSAARRRRPPGKADPSHRSRDAGPRRDQPHLDPIAAGTSRRHSGRRTDQDNAGPQGHRRPTGENVSWTRWLNFGRTRMPALRKSAMTRRPHRAR